MEPQRRVQVVLGEAERDDGLLRFVLEAEGFDLVGLASNDEELARVLRGARPSVIVLDGGISAAAALRARECVVDAALVVVWPDGVSAVLAEERVEPSLVIEDLGDAVRRAADQHRPTTEPIVVLDAGDGPAIVVDTDQGPSSIPQPLSTTPSKPRRAGRRMRVLVAAATWFLVITALTAIATAVPHVVDTFRGGRTERPSAATSPERTGQSDPVTGLEPRGQRDRCENAANGNAAQNGNGSATSVRAHGCPSQGGSGGNVNVGGRPDDPGNQGNGGASGGHGSHGAPGDTVTDDSDDPVPHGRSDEEHGPPHEETSGGTENPHGHAGENGLGDQHG